MSGTYTGTFTTVPGGRQLILQTLITGGTGRLAGVTGTVTTTVNVNVNAAA
jgi:hypothetical protein